MRLINADEIVTMCENVIQHGIADEDGDHVITAESMLFAVNHLPTIDAVPVVHGRWEEVPYKTIEHGEVVIRGKTVRCSACRHAEKGWGKGMNFCPHCGAKMDGKDDGNEKAD